MVFRVVNGKQVIQEMPSSYRDRKSEKFLNSEFDVKPITERLHIGFTSGAYRN